MLVVLGWFFCVFSFVVRCVVVVRIGVVVLGWVGELVVVCICCGLGEFGVWCILVFSKKNGYC